MLHDSALYTFTIDIDIVIDTYTVPPKLSESDSSELYERILIRFGSKMWNSFINHTACSTVAELSFSTFIGFRRQQLK